MLCSGSGVYVTKNMKTSLSFMMAHSYINVEDTAIFQVSNFKCHHKL